MLLVVSNLFAFTVLVLLVGFEKINTKLGSEKYFCKVTVGVALSLTKESHNVQSKLGLGIKMRLRSEQVS